MVKIHWKLFWVLPLISFIGFPCFAQEQDVSFFVVGKSTRFIQDFDGQLSPDGAYFFGEIFLQPGGQVTEPRLTTPRQNFSEFATRRSGSLRSIPRQDFDSVEALDEAYPDGTCTLHAQSPSGNIVEHSVTFHHRADHPERFPHPVQIFFHQGGVAIHPEQVDPQQDLLISWTPFSSGRADPNRICSDLIFAIGSSEETEESPFRTELPFESIPALTYADTHFRIPSERLQAGKTFNILVEHAILAETNRQDHVVGLSAFATVTTATFVVSADQNEKTLPSEN